MSTLRPVRKQQSPYEPILDALPVAAASHSLECINNRAIRLTGFSDSDFIADPGLWIRQTHPDDRTAKVALADSEACCAAIRAGDNHVGIGIDLPRKIADVVFRKESQRKGQMII